MHVYKLLYIFLLTSSILHIIFARATFDTSNKDRVQSSEDTDESISSPYDSKRYRRQKYKEPSSSFQKRDIFGNQNDNLIQVILDADNKRAVALLENNAEGQARYDLAADSASELDPSNQQVINLVYPVQFDRRERRDTSRNRRDLVKRNINDDSKKKRKATESKTKLNDNNCPPQHAVDSKDAGSSTVIKRESSSSSWKPSQLNALTSSLNKVQDDWEEIDNLRSILNGMGLLDIPEKRELNEQKTEDKRDVKKDENLVQKREDIQKAEDENWKQDTNSAPEEKKKREINQEEEEAEEVVENDTDLQKRDTDSEEDSEDENLDDQLEKRKIQEQITDDCDELDGFDSKDVQRVERNKRQNLESDTNKEKRRSDEDEYAKKMEAEIQTKINAIKEKVKREITLEENKREKRETLKDKNEETSNQAKTKKRAVEDDESEKHEAIADDLDLKKREALDDLNSAKETSEDADIEKRDTSKELDLEEHDTKDLVKREASNKLNAEPSDIAKEVTNESPLKKRDLSELEEEDESELEKRDLSDDGFEIADKSDSVVKRDFQSKSASEKLEALKAMDLLLQKRAESLREREDGVEKRDNYKKPNLRSKKRETAKDNNANQEKHDSLTDFDRTLVKRDIKDPTLDSKTPDLHLEKREKSDETENEMESGESPKMKVKKRSTINKRELKSRSKRKTETEKKDETNKGCETHDSKQKMADTNKKIFKREIATSNLDEQNLENVGSEQLQDDTLKLNKRAVGTTYLDLEKESEVKNDEDNVKLVKRDIGMYDLTDLDLDTNAPALKRVKRKIETSNLDETGSSGTNSKIITLADLELENSQIPKDSSKLVKREIPEESSSKLEQTASDLNSPIAEDPEKEVKREITADESKLTDNSDSSDEYPVPVGNLHGLPLRFNGNQRNLDTEPETYFENPNLNIRRKRADFDFNPYQADDNMEQEADESEDYSSSVLAKKRALNDDEPEEYIRTYYPERRQLRTFAKNDDSKDDEEEEEEDEEENEYFGPLPESYNGELTRYKRVKRYN